MNNNNITEINKLIGMTSELIHIKSNLPANVSGVDNNNILVTVIDKQIELYTSMIQNLQNDSKEDPSTFGPDFKMPYHQPPIMPPEYTLDNPKPSVPPSCSIDDVILTTNKDGMILTTNNKETVVIDQHTAHIGDSVNIPSCTIKEPEPPIIQMYANNTDYEKALKLYNEKHNIATKPPIITTTTLNKDVKPLDSIVLPNH